MSTHRVRLHQAVGVALIVGVMLVSGCSGDSSKAAPTTKALTKTSTTSTSAPAAPTVHMFDAGDTTFYYVPDPIPTGHHGDLIRVQPIEGAPDGVTWQRIMYLSETVSGEPKVDTGVLTLPTADAPTGGWPLFAHAHGSTGLADDCAPSVSLSDDATFAPEIALLSAWAPTYAIAIVSADYEGLGGPGRHPFLVGVSEGRSVLDSILAARQIPNVQFQDRVGIIGYSQGGHAAAWANQIARTWTPDLDIVGVLAGAPATEVASLVKRQGQPAAVQLAGALAAADHSLDLNSVLTDAGSDFLAQLDRSCKTPAQPADAPLTKLDITTTKPWSTALTDNEPGSEPGAAPVLIVHSEVDQNVPVGDSEVFEQRLCAAGGVVERRLLPDGNHVAAAIPAYEQGIKWILDLEKGTKPTSTCP